jgi:hypothetical protein
MLELRHVEAMERPIPEKIPRAFQGQFGLADAGRTKKQKRPQWLIRRLKPKLPTLQN